jgi:hypothetical protein
MSIYKGTTLIAGALPNAANQDLSNVPTTKGILTESYNNSGSWYRVYADGWCEQGGVITPSSTTVNYQVTLLKSYIDTNYVLSLNNTEPNAYSSSTSTANDDRVVTASSRTNRKATGSFYICRVVSGFTTNWRACGYIS